MKKALKIIVISLLVALAIFYVVAYIVWKDQTTYITECIINFINKPLPIIGVSIAIIGFFVFKCFVATRFGKKAINEYKEENRALKEQIIEKEKELFGLAEDMSYQVGQYCKMIDNLEETLEKHLALSKNIKDKELIKTLKGEETYGEEKIESNPEEETL